MTYSWALIIVIVSWSFIGVKATTTLLRWLAPGYATLLSPDDFIFLSLFILRTFYARYITLLVNRSWIAPEVVVVKPLLRTEAASASSP